MNEHEREGDLMEIGDSLSEMAMMPVYEDMDDNTNGSGKMSSSLPISSKGINRHKSSSSSASKPGDRRRRPMSVPDPFFREAVRSNSDPGKRPFIRKAEPKKLAETGDENMDVDDGKENSQPQIERLILQDSEDDNYMRYLKSVKCDELIPPSSKIVTLDTRLSMKKAFFALVANEIRSAPLWDSAQHSFVGMLTVTDFIEILRHYYKSPLVQITELEDHRVETWKKMAPNASLRPRLVSLKASATLYDAVAFLTENKIHRLPIVDTSTGAVLYILTHKRILRFLYLHFPDMGVPSYMSQTLEELSIGSYENVAMVSPDTPLIVAHNIIMERRISALPIVDDNGKVIDIYAKYDAFNLAEGRAYNNLDVTVRQALERRSSGIEGVIVCYPHETLSIVINRLVEKQVHRLVVVDSHEHCLGIISLSDLMKFLVLRSTDEVF